MRILVTGRQQGLMLLELLVVLAIIGLLAGLAVVNLTAGSVSALQMQRNGLVSLALKTRQQAVRYQRLQGIRVERSGRIGVFYWFRGQWWPDQQLNAGEAHFSDAVAWRFRLPANKRASSVGPQILFSPEGLVHPFQLTLWLQSAQPSDSEIMLNENLLTPALQGL